MIRWGHGVDNGIRAVIYLAKQEVNSRTPLKRIAEDLKVSATFLAKILQSYSRAGIVNASRGARGGYLLKKMPAEITLRDLIENIMESAPVGSCPMIGRFCPRQKECSVYTVLVSVEKAVSELVENKTLVDLCNGTNPV